MKIRLTQGKVDHLVYSGSGKPHEIVWDDEVKGFGVRIFKSGKKTYILFYRFHGRQRFKKIGDTTEMALAQARRIAAQWIMQIRAGNDPAQKDERTGSSMNALFDEYLEHYAKPKKKTWKEDERRINTHLRAAFGRKRIEDIKRIDIEKLHRKVGKNNGKREANLITALLSKIFNLATVWGHLSDGAVNPASRIEKFKDNKRDRWIKPDEIGTFFDALENEPGIDIRAGILLYLLTGLRNRELMSIALDDIEVWEDQEDGRTIKRGRISIKENKADRPFFVSLSPAAVEIIGTIPRKQGSPWLFPSSRNPMEHYRQFPRVAWEKFCKRAGFEDLHIHDLRRTFASWLTEFGEPEQMVAKLLNQTSTTVTRTVYAHHTQKPLEAAIDRHSDKIMEFMKIKKVDESAV